MPTLELYRPRLGPPVTGYLDELDEMLHEDLPGLVAQYLPRASLHGVTEYQLVAWLSNVDEATGLPLSDQQRLLDYPETAELYDVQVDTLRQWVGAYNTAVRTRQPLNSSCFIKPDLSKGTKVRMWDRARCILFGWRSTRLVAGTLIPIKRKPPGPPVRS